MKTIVFLLAFATFAYAQVISDLYTDVYDDINLDEILGNQVLLDPYIKCVLDEGRCSPEGNVLKTHIPEALATSCSRCTEAQKVGATKVISYLVNNQQDSWAQLVAKYDPDNIYAARYETETSTVSA